MSTHRTTGRALQTGFGLALAAAFALVNGCAAMDAADEAGQPEVEPIEDAQGAVLDSGIFRCTIGGGQPGYLIVQPDPYSTCTRHAGFRPGASGKYCLGGACPSCWVLARDLQCILQN
jgi:hypothetical protein